MKGAVLLVLAASSRAHASTELALPPGSLLALSPAAALPALLVGLALLAMSALCAGATGALLRQPSPDRDELVSLRMGSDLANALLTAVMVGLLVPGQAAGGPWWTIAVVVPAVLLFGEVLPRALARQAHDGLAGRVAPAVRLFTLLVSPVLALFDGLARFVLSAAGASRGRSPLAVREARLLALVEEGRVAGAVGPMEEAMIHKVVEFGDLQVGRLMTPRPDIVSFSLTTPWPELLDGLRQAGHSRVPIWKDRPDNVIGVLVVKDLLPHFASQYREAEPGPREPRDLPLPPGQLQKLLRAPHFVPGSKRAEELLAEFRAERHHLALVVDEHGNVVGLVTLDDLLAELVGELLDEGDELPVEPGRSVDGVSTIRGNMDVDDFEARFGRALPEGEYDTVAGFLLDQVGRVPSEGEVVQWEGLRFVVCGLEGRRITEVCVHLPSAPVAEEADAPEAPLAPGAAR